MKRAALLALLFAPIWAGPDLSLLPSYGAQLENVVVTDSTVTLFFRQASNLVYAVVGCDPCSPPPRIWKEIYRVRAGKLVKDTTIQAQVVTPPSEIVTWPDEGGSP